MVARAPRVILVVLALSASVVACGDDGPVAIAESEVGEETSTTGAAGQTDDDAAQNEELALAAAAGRWTTVDVDGSNISLTIGERDGRIEFSYRDDGATVCGLDTAGNPQYPIEFEESTVVDELTITVEGVTATCSVTGATHTFDWTISYDPASDTLNEEVSFELEGEFLSETYVYERA